MKIEIKRLRNSSLALIVSFNQNLKALLLVLFGFVSFSANAEVIWREVESSKIIAMDYEVDPKKSDIPAHGAYGFGWPKPVRGCKFGHYALPDNQVSNELLVHMYIASEELKKFKVAIDNTKYLNGMCTIVDVSPRD